MSLAVGISTAIAVAGAIVAVSLNNILHAVFGLAVSLLGVAGIFLALGSPFIAAMEVLIYVGGISVAMVFAVMLSYSIASKPQVASTTRRTIALVASTSFFLAVAFTIHGTTFEAHDVVADGSVASIGRDLLTHYNLVFEVLSLILLVAIMGAISLAKRDKEEQQP